MGRVSWKKRQRSHFLPAIGSVDQHSQLQMWLDGPDNIFYTIIIPKKRKQDLKLNYSNKLFPSYLKKKSLGNILFNMGIATYKELVKAKKPVRLIYLDDDSLYPAVKLMAFFMLEVPVIGKLLRINPFDQPAVEKVKVLTKSYYQKMEKIRVLPNHIIDSIAAGEVIERPFSIIKELLENSIDAGSENINIFIEGGGENKIIIQDDGSGIDENDLSICIKRHATSKIANNDLTRIKTLGFRGEALYAIASVSRMEITSKTTSMINAVKLIVKENKIIEIKPSKGKKELIY